MEYPDIILTLQVGKKKKVGFTVERRSRHGIRVAHIWRGPGRKEIEKDEMKELFNMLEDLIIEVNRQIIFKSEAGLSVDKNEI